MPVVASWDGANRRIYLHADTVDSDWHPVDIYREYRTERRTNEAFRKWEPFLKYEGNVPKGGGKATPRYMTLLDGVRIIPYDAAGVTTATGEIITDDQQSPFDYTPLVNPMVVNVASAEAEIVYIEIESPIQDRLDYAGIIHVDSTSGITGQVHPAGTTGSPVDNATDAVVLAATYGARTLEFVGTFTEGVVSFAGLNIHGRNPVSSILVLGGGSTLYTNVLDATVVGTANGRIYVTNSIIGNLAGFSGGLVESVLGGTITVDATYTETLTLLSCTSGIAGVGRPTLDVNSAACDISCREYYGGLTISNFNQAGSSASFDLASAIIELDDTCTAGTVKVYGLGRLVDQLGNNIPTGTHNGVTVINETIAATTANQAPLDQANLDRITNDIMNYTGP